MHADSGMSTDWKMKLREKAEELEDWIDRTALRIGDALFGEATSEKIFGPHPIR